MNKKILTIIISVAIVLGLGMYLFMDINKKPNINTPNVEQTIDSTNKNDTIEFLRAVHGLKIESVELIDNPVGFDGSFLAPEESIRNGVDYFLKKSKNEKISKVNIDIGSGYIKATVDYNIIKDIITPIEFKITPSLNKNKDLLLKIDEVKFLDLKISKWIIDLGVKNFIKDWFPKDSEMVVEFNEGNVLIDKSNFKGITLKNISIDSEKLKLDMIINLEQ
ncbi:MAG: hypothetical protein ACRC3Y_03710 [Romboutsia sp.]